MLVLIEIQCVINSLRQTTVQTRFCVFWKWYWEETQSVINSFRETIVHTNLEFHRGGWSEARRHTTPWKVDQVLTNAAGKLITQPHERVDQVLTNAAGRDHHTPSWMLDQVLTNAAGREQVYYCRICLCPIFVFFPASTTLDHTSSMSGPWKTHNEEEGPFLCWGGTL